MKRKEIKLEELRQEMDFWAIGDKVAIFKSYENFDSLYKESGFCILKAWSNDFIFIQGNDDSIWSVELKHFDYNKTYKWRTHFSQAYDKMKIEPPFANNYKSQIEEISKKKSLSANEFIYNNKVINMKHLDEEDLIYYHKKAIDFNFKSLSDKISNYLIENYKK